jgi:hypothetical protein
LSLCHGSLQEQLLSPSILYYDKGEIYWDCITISASESSPIWASLLDDTDPDETWALRLIRRTIAGSVVDDTLRTRISEAWVEIIKNYSARNLTKFSDKLIALQGIIEPLKAILGDDAVAGMWRNQIWRQLIWWTQSPVPFQQSFLAPTWSWLGISGRVYYHNSLLGEDPQQDTVIHKFTDIQQFDFMVDQVEIQDLPGATGVVGHITITAKSFPYRLTVTDLKKPVYKRWNSATLRINTGRWLLDRPMDLPMDLHCIIVAEDPVAKLLVCLCVVPDDEHGKKWKRIGLCHWDGLAWQVPAFIGTSPETQTFMLV